MQGITLLTRDVQEGEWIEGSDAGYMQHAPSLVEAVGVDARPDLDVYFSLNCLKFIELIRCAHSFLKGGCGERAHLCFLIG